MESHDPCLFCGYNLTGLSHEATCPECGVPVTEARRGYSLHHAPERYVRLLARSVLTIQTATAAILGLRLVRYLIWMAVNYLWPDSIRELMFNVTRVVSSMLTLLMLVPFLAAAMAWWQLTSPDPRAQERQDRLTPLRYAVRIAATAQASFMLLATPLWIYWMFSPGSWPFWSQYVRGTDGVVSFLLASSLFVTAVLLLRVLARRLGAPGLRRWITNLLWIGPVAAILGQGAQFASFNLAGFGGFWLIGAVDLLSRALWLVVWVGTLESLRRRLLTAADRIPPPPPSDDDW